MSYEPSRAHLNRRHHRPIPVGYDLSGTADNDAQPRPDPAADLARLRAERDEAVKLLKNVVNACTIGHERKLHVAKISRFMVGVVVGDISAYLARIQQEPNT